MRYWITLLLTVFVSVFNVISGQIDEYIDFLQKPQLSAKNYILKQFENHDMVILCERDHNELTQYDLYLDVISDPWFIKNVTNVFIETGSYSNRDAINKFLHTRYDDYEAKESDLIRICQNVGFYPSWNNFNYYFFLDQINTINCTFESTERINLFPSDFEFDWEKINSAEDYTNWRKDAFWVNDRDSLMANHIIIQYERQIEKHGKEKCLVILNYRHAFSRFVRNEARNLLIPCTGAILKDKYGGRVVNVLVHNMGTTKRIIDDKPWNNELEPVPIQQGKWDAAFRILGYESIGFDFTNSPFGEDKFDFWALEETELTYKDYFDGYVYFLSLEKLKVVEGIPHLFDYNDFKEELYRRDLIFSESYDRDQPDASKYDGYDQIRIKQVYGIDNSRRLIHQWIE